MEELILMKVTVVTDDDTGMYNVGDVDFGISGALEREIHEQGVEFADKLLDSLGYLAHQVWNIKDQVHKEEQLNEVLCGDVCVPQATNPIPDYVEPPPSGEPSP